MQESKDIQRIEVLPKRTMLWFDVGIKRYTTKNALHGLFDSCGLMQESKDIQLERPRGRRESGCGLMQESKDIQPIQQFEEIPDVVV